MLLYYNGDCLRQLFQVAGSAVWKKDTFAIACFVAAATVALQVLHDTQQDYAITVPHQYPMQALGAIAIFALVFRTNQAWSRYWEAVTNIHFMYSKWADAYSQFCGFVSVTILKIQEGGDAAVGEKIARLLDMHEKVENDFLLLSAMACDRICRGDCAQMKRRSDLKVPWASRIVMREDLRKGLDPTNAKGMPNFKKLKKIDEHIIMGATPSIEEMDVQGFWAAEYAVRKPPSGIKYDLLRDSSDRANMVVNWLNHNLAYISGDLYVAPPIQSRMFQEISNGMLGFNNALKVADIPISFPYSQLVLMLMFVWNCLIPVYVMNFTKSLIGGPVLAFSLSMFLFCMHDIAHELENPYGQGANGLCVPEFHSRFCLVVTDASRSCHNPPRPPRVSARFWNSRRSAFPTDGMGTESLLEQEVVPGPLPRRSILGQEFRKSFTNIPFSNSGSHDDLSLREERSEITPIPEEGSHQATMALRDSFLTGNPSDGSACSARSPKTSVAQSVTDCTCVEPDSPLASLLGPWAGRGHNFTREAPPTKERKLEQCPRPFSDTTGKVTPNATGSAGMDGLLLRLTEISERLEHHLVIISQELISSRTEASPRRDPILQQEGPPGFCQL